MVRTVAIIVSVRIWGEVRVADFEHVRVPVMNEG